MKSKKILIVYLKLRMESIAPKELMFNKIIKDLTDEGRTISKTISNSENSIALFEDGTKVTLMPFGQSLRGVGRVTDLYIDETILVLPNGSHFVNERLVPLVVAGHNYTDFDVDGSAQERVKSFMLKDNKLEIYDYDGE